MFKETVTFTDYNGVEITKDYYFHLNEAEIMEMELGTEGGLAEKIETIVKAQQRPTIIKTFKEILLKAYGEKSADGSRFKKSADISEAFEQSPASPILFMKYATDADAGAKFVNGIMPSDKQMSAEQLHDRPGQ